MDTFTERALIEAKRRMLVGGELASSTREIFIEETFPKAFEAHIPSILFWRAFEKACGSIVPNEQEDPVLRPQPLLKERKGSMTLESLRRKKGIDLTSEMKIKKQGTSQEWTDARETMLSYTLTCNLNGKDEKGETMLTLAASHGRAHIVNLLCNIKCDPNIENAKCWTAVHVAAIYGHIPVLQVFLTLGIKMDVQDSHMGFTPAHLAASSDKVKVIEFLHSTHKVDLTKTARNGYNLMHTAAEAGSEEVMQFLLQTYPKMLVQKDFLQEGPLHKAAKAFHTKIYKAMTKTCLEKGYDTPMERNIQDDSAEDLATFNTRYIY